MRVLPLLLVLAAGCGTIGIEGEDDGVLFPSARVRSRPDRTGTGWFTGAEAELAWGSGSSVQALPAGESIDFHGEVFSGPGSVDLDFDLLLAHAAGSGGYAFGERFRVEGLYGLSLQRLDLEVSGGGESERDIDTGVGVMFGGRTTWQATDWLHLYAQGSFHTGFSGDFVEVGTVDLGAGASRKGPVELLVGWRWWFYEADSVGSDVELDLSGPFLTFGLKF